MNIFLKIILFFCSYSPLLLLILLNFFNEDKRFKFMVSKSNYNFYVLLGILILTFFLIYVISEKILITRSIKKNKFKYRYLINAKTIKNDVLMDYLITVLIPFVAIKFKTMIDVVIIIFIFLILIIIYIQGNLIYINPVIFLRYNVYECYVSANSEFNSKTSVIVITKNPITKMLPGENMKLYRISENIYYLLE